jgi:hypothetical protein
MKRLFAWSVSEGRLGVEIVIEDDFELVFLLFDLMEKIVFIMRRRGRSGCG